MVSTWEQKNKKYILNPVGNYTMTASGKANQKKWLQRLRWLLPQRSSCPATRWSPWMAGLLGCLFSLYTIPCPGVRNDLTNGAICFYGYHVYIYICTNRSTYVTKTLVVHSANVLWQGRVFLNHLGLGKPSQKCFPCSSKSAVLCVKCIGRKKLW